MRRVEDTIPYDAEAKKVSVSYPWTEDICKLTDILGQAMDFQSSLECNLLKAQTLLETYNAELQKFLDRWLYQNELDTYSGPVS